LNGCPETIRDLLLKTGNIGVAPAVRGRVRRFSQAAGSTFDVAHRELSLGRFQSILFAELDGPRTRSIDIQIMGVGPAGGN